MATRLRAIVRSLADTGQLDRFDVFILSDSRQRDCLREEEAVWAQLCREPLTAGRVFYRNRPDNVGRKAGNIADFCRRWGRQYSYFVILDADSVMTGDTLVQLVGLMEANPHAGLLQTLPHPVARRDAVRPRPAVRRAPLRAGLRRRPELLVSRPQQLLGPQRDHPLRGVHERRGAADPVRPPAARRRDPQPRLRRGGAAAARRLVGLDGARARRQLRGAAGQPQGLPRPRPALVPGQPAARAPADRQRPDAGQPAASRPRRDVLRRLADVAPAAGADDRRGRRASACGPRRGFRR